MSSSSTRSVPSPPRLPASVTAATGTVPVTATSVNRMLPDREMPGTIVTWPVPPPSETVPGLPVTVPRSWTSPAGSMFSWPSVAVSVPWLSRRVWTYSVAAVPVLRRMPPGWTRTRPGSPVWVIA